VNPKVKNIFKCDSCGKFRKKTEIVEMGGENDEWWKECRYCMSDSDYNTYFDKPESDSAIL